jgi:hypothetical protein
MEEQVNLYNTYTDDEATPMECIIMFKKLIRPKGCFSQEELKEIICDWIDYNVINTI